MDSNQRIFLLVDDDSDDRELFLEAVESLDPPVQCLVAIDGQDALDLLASLNDEDLPEVIFLDVNMPVMNGWDCLKTIKQQEKYKHIPVIMCSTSSHQREIDTAIDLGALCFCVKPEKFTTLKQIVEIVNKHLGDNLQEELQKSKTVSFKC